MPYSSLTPWRLTVEITDNFWDEKIASRLILDPETGCLVWTGAKTEDGYGQVYVPGVGTRSVHRVVYEKFNGPIPEGLQVDHLCRNPACSAIAHLEVVSPRLNTLRGATVTAQNASRTHCPYGHELAGANLVAASLKRGQRQCRTCIGVKSRLQAESIQAARKSLGYTWQRYVAEFGRSTAVAIEVQRRLEAGESLDGVQDVGPGKGWHGKREITIEPDTSLTEEDIA
jgi:hypothetical protein